MFIEYPLTLPQGYTRNQILNIAKSATSFPYEIYFVQNDKICNGKSFLGIVAFFLPLKAGDTLVLRFLPHTNQEEINFLKENLFSSTPQSELDHFEQEGLKKTMHAWQHAEETWTPHVRLTAKSFLKS
ncbi:HPr family phosphocarrier protein [Hazenella sp. IB182353]|uniref:HPr family phosphocarrier protein n=1 Tax=Polycladospora coralii TaxID=2771432 RepID=UPI001745D2C3|nr:HPr family phosphocarrier protein [Polycladospora coralii]MBS7530984.1 HPr family phosphocarrier protein [Polycladospora coralii]